MANTAGEKKFLKQNITSIRIIHYSCQNLSDQNEGLSPRITSIAVQDFESRMMHSFSIHLVAEKSGLSRSEIAAHYDELEKKMLEEFFSFVGSKLGGVWVHWNMSNINFGFETLEHRHEVLCKTMPPKIPDSRRRNLSGLIVAKYGRDCVDHPRMEKLMSINGGLPRDFLSGAHEVEAFKNGEFLRLHRSTMAKVYWITEMLEKFLFGRINTQRNNWREKLDIAFESKVAKAIGLFASLLAILQLFSLLFA